MNSVGEEKALHMMEQTDSSACSSSLVGGKNEFCRRGEGVRQDCCECYSSVPWATAFVFQGHRAS